MSAEFVSVTFRCDADLQAAFSAACKANDRPASVILRDAMRDYVAANAQPGLPFEAQTKVKVKPKAKAAGGVTR